MAGANMRLRSETKLSSPFLVFRPLEATMKKTLVMTCALLALAAGLASAQTGVNLSWTDCGAAGIQNATFACTSNIGTNALIGSVLPPAGADQVNGMVGIVDL